MRTRMSMAIRLLCLGCIIPAVLSVIVYYGFSTNYTTGVFLGTGFSAPV